MQNRIQLTILINFGVCICIVYSIFKYKIEFLIWKTLFRQLGTLDADVMNLYKRTLWYMFYFDLRGHLLTKIEYNFKKIQWQPYFLSHILR